MTEVRGRSVTQVAVIVLTKNGLQLAKRLQSGFDEIEVYVSRKISPLDEVDPSFVRFDGSVSSLLSELFPKYRGIIFILSLGAVVRLIAPLLQDKKTDPCVVVVDNIGKFAISVSAGHLGGGNQLTNKVANVLGAIPVITTASDVQQTISVDLIGRDQGWVVEMTKEVTAVSAAVVNEETVAVFQESGRTDWWQGSWPKHLIRVNRLEEIHALNAKVSIIISHRQYQEALLSTIRPYVMIRPKVIVLGLGCNRGTDLAEIEAVVKETLDELAVSLDSVTCVASIDLKANEEGLLRIVEKHQWDFVTYSPEELNEVPIEQPSSTVFKYTGAYAVSEPAAKLASGNDQLLLVKKKSGNVTISVGIINETKEGGDQ